VLPSLQDFPVNPYIGQTFVHNPGGRSIQYEWDGTNWQPTLGYGDITTYVDPAGTDDLDHGFAIGADAFLTIQFAWDMLPPIVRGGSIDINLSDDVFTENLTITQQPVLSQGEHLYINGAAMTVDAALVATGGVQGAGAVPPNVLGVFVVGVYDNLLIRFTSGANNGEIRVIGQTTITNLYLVGAALPAAPVNLDTYDILSWSTTIDGYIHVRGCYHNNDAGQMNFVSIAITYNVSLPAAYGTVYANQSSVGFAYCDIVNNGSTAAVHSDVNNYLNCWRCVIRITGAAWQAGAWAEWRSQIDLLQCRVVGTDVVNHIGFLVQMHSGGALDNCEVTGCIHGAQIETNSVLNTFSLTTITSFIHGNGRGVQVVNHSMACFTVVSVTYGVLLDGNADINTVADTSAEAASFSWLN